MPEDSEKIRRKRMSKRVECSVHHCLELRYFQDCNCTVVIVSNSVRVQDLTFFFFSDPDHIKINHDEKISSRSLFYYKLATKY